MNLSNIKKVGFIENFNPKKGYPEYAKEVAVKPVKLNMDTVTSTSTKGNTEVPNWKRNQTKAIKKAKKAFKSRVGLDYKPTIAISTKLV